MLANKVVSVRPAIGKSLEDIQNEWDRIAHVRHEQISSGADISFNYVLKPAIVNLLEGCNLSKVIDLGCGTGELTAKLARLSGEVTGVDSSALSIEIARETSAELPNIHFCESFIEDYANSDSGPQFTTAVANMTLMNCLDLEAFLQAAARVLQPEGSLIATITHPCFWPSYWGYADADWFKYNQEIVVEAPFRISSESTDYVTTHVHRPLSTYQDTLAQAGFAIDKLLEPFPNEEVQSMYPVPWKYPRFLALRAFLSG